MPEPKISVNIVAYNRAGYARQAIDSALAQTCADFEIVAVDDCSSDETGEIIKKYCEQDSRIKYFRLEQKSGIARARNFALAKSSGKYIAVLDSDDVWADNDKLKKQSEFLDGSKEYVLVGGAVIVIDGAGSEIRRYKNPTEDKEIRKSMLWRNPFIHSSVMYRRELALGLGGYDESVKIGEEYDLWLKLGNAGKMKNLSDYFVKYRVHGGGVSVSSRVRGALDTKKIIARHAARYPYGFLARIKTYARILYAVFLIVLDKFRFSRHA